MIYLIRHGEAAAGWGDHPDPELSLLGQKQAQAVSDELGRLGVSHVVTSPMRRCQQTSQPFAAALGVKPIILDAVSEIITPPGTPDRVAWLRELMAGNWPAEMAAWRQSAVDALDALPDGAAVFSHFVAINAIVGRVLEREDVLVFRPGHCSITVLDPNESGGFRLVQLGDEAATKVL